MRKGCITLFFCSFVLWNIEAAPVNIKDFDFLTKQSRDDEISSDIEGKKQQQVYEKEQKTKKNQSDIAEKTDTKTQRLELQRKILKFVRNSTKESSFNWGMNVNCLQELTDNSLVVTAESIDDIRKDPNTAFMKIDVYEGANLAILLLRSFNYILSGTDESLTDLLNTINNNDTLKSALNELIKSLTKLQNYEKIDFDNSEYIAEYGNALGSFTKLITEAESDTQLVALYSWFIDFLKVSQKFTDLVYVRYATEKMLSRIRSTLEGVQTLSTSTSGSISVDIPIVVIPGLSINLDFFAKNQSSAASSISFYTVTKSEGMKGGLSFKLPIAKLSAKGGVEKAGVDMFYSLESYMDYLNSCASSKLERYHAKKQQGMQNALEDRKDMQNKEKEALKNNGMLEADFKLFHALPNLGVSLVWIDITKGKAKDKAKEITVSGELSASVVAGFADLGVTLKASSTEKRYIKGAPLLSLLNSDCSLIDGIGLEYITKIIGAKYDFSESVQHSYILHGYLNAYVSVLEKLATTTSSAEKKEAEKKKHAYEKLLSPKKLIGSYGREGVLKASILTAAILRASVPDNDQYQILRFKKIYDVLCNLAKLCEFSKNNSGIRRRVGYGKKAEIKSEVSVKSSCLQAEFVCGIPILGNTAFLINRIKTTGSPLLDEDGKELTLKFTLPTKLGKIVGKSYINKKLKSIFSDIDVNKGSTADLKDFQNLATIWGASKTVEIGMGDTRNIVDIASKSAKADEKRQGVTDNILDFSGKTATDVAISSAGLPVGIGAYSPSIFTVSLVFVAPPENVSKLIPLPNQSIIENKKGRWAVNYVLLSNPSQKKLSKSFGSDVAVSVKAKIETNKTTKIVGSDSLHDLISKVDALSLGISDSKSHESTAIDTFLKTQSKQLLKIFKKIAKMNTNAAFELQRMYNDMLARIQSTKDREDCEKLFRDFINACMSLSETEGTSGVERAVDAGNENDLSTIGAEMNAVVTENTESESNAGSNQMLNMQEFKKAFDLFRKILDRYYQHVFKPHYDKAFSREL